jgi:hypothetical protein
MMCQLKQFTLLFTMICCTQEVGQLSNQIALRGDEEGAIQNLPGMIAAAFLPSWTMFSLLVGWLGTKSKLASLSLNQEASQKELEGVRKMSHCLTSPRLRRK